MANFEDIAKKAFYMGVGFASYAQERANDTLQDLKVQAQKLADEMAARGEMSTDEARKFVDDLVEQAQQKNVSGNERDGKQPRRIEIVDEDEATSEINENSDEIRQQVEFLQEELQRLKKKM